MLKMPKSLSAFTLLLALSACNDSEVKTRDGAIPQAYMTQSAQLAGAYVGKFNGARGVLTVSFEGNKPTVDYDGQAGTDLVGVPCESSIGALESIAILGRRNGKVNAVSATFAFDPNHCEAVAGRELNLKFYMNADGTTTVKAAIAGPDLDGSVDCTNGSPNAGFTCPGGRVAGQYYTGKFTKDE
jgi:hypothetical protein